MALTDKNKIVAFYTLETELADRFDTYLTQASDRVLDLIGQTKYDELDALPDTNPDRQRADLAESALALYYALPQLNLRITKLGGIVRSTGYEDSRTEIMNKFEADRYRGKLWTDAHNLLEKWIIREVNSENEYTSFTGPFSITAIVDEDGTAESTT